MKAIVIIRTSTTKQEVETQRKETVSYTFDYNRKDKTMSRVAIENGEQEYEVVNIPVVRAIKGRKRNYSNSRYSLTNVQG